MQNPPFFAKKIPQTNQTDCIARLAIRGICNAEMIYYRTAQSGAYHMKQPLPLRNRSNGCIKAIGLTVFQIVVGFFADSKHGEDILMLESSFDVEIRNQL